MKERVLGLFWLTVFVLLGFFLTIEWLGSLPRIFPTKEEQQRPYMFGRQMYDHPWPKDFR